MGMDIYLRSIHEPFVANLKGKGWRTTDLQALFDKLRESGGYFRNGYNVGDVMWAMGMSWDDIFPLLDRGCRLSIYHARELIGMIEARPLTKESIATHYLKNMTNGVNEHPKTGATFRRIENVVEPPTPDFENVVHILQLRREELLVILRKSIELNEPLLCDGGKGGRCDESPPEISALLYRSARQAALLFSSSRSAMAASGSGHRGLCNRLRCASGADQSKPPCDDTAQR
jgi:hypothetical protein